MTFTAPFTVVRCDNFIDCEVEGTVAGKRGVIHEVYDVVCKCLCGAAIELSVEEDRLAVEALEKAAQDAAEREAAA